MYYTLPPEGNVKNTYKLAGILALVVFVSTGCANRAISKVEPGVNLASIKTVYVKKHLADDRGTNALIVEKLSSKGIAVTSGTDGYPKNVDAVLTYKDTWVWDLTPYMLELDVVIREPDSNLPIAKANSMHTSLSRFTPKQMVDEAIDNLFNGTK